MAHPDGEFEMNLASCHRTIKGWKQWHFRKNSVHKTEIRLRCYHAAPEQIFWKYFIELKAEGSEIEQHRISVEAYDSLSSDTKLIREHYQSVEFIVLEKNYA